ncbi:hypothetical protein Tco_0969419 [Tanacetum coccineum]
MESSSLNLEEMELQQMQLDERELHQKCLAGFEKLKTHLGFLRSSFNFLNTRLFEIAFRIFFREEHQTFIEKMYHNFNYLKWQLERDNFHGHDSKNCLVVLRTQFKEFFKLIKVNASDVPNKKWQESFNDGTKWEPKIFRSALLRVLEELDKLIDERALKYEELRVKESEFQAIKEIAKWLKESEIKQQESLVIEGTVMEACLSTNGATIKACLVTEGASLKACLVNEGITLNDNTSVTEGSGTEPANSSSKTLFRSSADENKSSDKESNNSERNDADADIGSSNDNNTLLGVYHDLFKNMFARGIQSHEPPESISDTYEVNENNSNISSDIPNMDLDRNKEEHDYVDYEQHHAFLASLINNLKCDVEKCNKVNREAQQANALLINELDRYKKKEKNILQKI